MEEIDISQLIGYFKSKVIYIIFVMSISFCLSSIYVNRFRIPEYTSFTTILLNQSNESSAINSTDVTLNKSLVSTYNEIIKSKRVLSQVINELSLEYDYEKLVSKISVGEVNDTSIIKISVTDPDTKLAADIANSIAEIFSKEIVDIYNIENISIIDAAEVTNVASSTSTLKIITLATFLGGFLAAAGIFVVYYFDTTLKNEEDIEKATGLPVIGIVPISREKIKGSVHRKYYEELAKKHKTQEILPVEREIRKLDNYEEEQVESYTEPEENNFNGDYYSFSKGVPVSSFKTTNDDYIEEVENDVNDINNSMSEINSETPDEKSILDEVDNLIYNKKSILDDEKDFSSDEKSLLDEVDSFTSNKKSSFEENQSNDLDDDDFDRQKFIDDIINSISSKIADDSEDEEDFSNENQSYKDYGQNEDNTESHLDEKSIFDDEIDDQSSNIEETLVESPSLEQVAPMSKSKRRRYKRRKYNYKRNNN